MTTLFIDSVDSPVGRLHFATTESALVALRFDAKERGVAGDPLGVGKILRRYFGGDLDAIDEIPIDLQEGTEFQRQVWNTLRKVPVGKTWSYQQLATAVGRPRAPAGQPRPRALSCPGAACANIIG